ncbi:DUF4359 domain-containing protein [Anabaena cylindrica FACHB-243]|uniref:DUF4359 domain-containing protein n=1 Tax=Anabaena cylindrica (strain ATCC 27899 / PCC 7122) TaxID=272123 RepID=K9ZG81_ANACC|nr:MULTISPECIES: DUF4359 domain-containing protein [Anabaena]AFZ57375.1 hypothetical protein Anacy_1887 [Anabaena cylindrica PCC 7122]MBD2421057.1 DUF4359 domain-containing protein [Anabaena cylindrica FACHB-243]MBY5284969.1 DUF4359 domain-containing protein [Anabaena sp. CCAP 1446/1C]MBY5306373.1 DUF4359 domain-containing protein [Anabaena sp. CCAP 1446/1C]MCM2405810.1 DUF4359 domain-containing protein [Anabaena sp. CCAP 1446/1C]
MKVWTIITSVGAAGIAVLGVTMAKTNPQQAEYEEYAVQRLTTYLKTDVCKKTPNFLQNLIQFNCDKLIESVNPQMRDIIASTTKRQNYIVFSVYSTELKLDNLLPNYKFETVGALDNFYTYKAEQQ